MSKSSLKQTLKDLDTKKISIRELNQDYLKRIKENENLNVFIYFSEENVLKQIDNLENDNSAKKLKGIPIAIKDLFCTKSMPTTAASKILENFNPTYESFVTQKLLDEGSIFVGKTNLDEFAMGSATNTSFFGNTINPLSKENEPLAPGGSSGGSAAAVAADLCLGATGTDTGGSIRQPASFCGVVGLRPSPGLVAAEDRPVGLLPFSTLGPMGRTVDDAYMLLQAQAGLNPYDPFATALNDELYAPLEAADLGSIRAMISVDLGAAPLSNAYRDIFNARTPLFRHHFAAAIDANPDFTDGHNCFEVLRGVNFVAAHGARVRDHRDQPSPNVVDNVDRGLAYSLADVAEAHLQQSRTRQIFRYQQR